MMKHNAVPWGQSYRDEITTPKPEGAPHEARETKSRLERGY